MSDPTEDLGEGGVPPIRLAGRVLKERWPIPDDVRVKILNRLCKIVDEDADHSPLKPPKLREVIAASRALLAADSLNLEQKRLDLLAKAGSDPAISELDEAEARADEYQPARPPAPDEGDPAQGPPGPLP